MKKMLTKEQARGAILGYYLSYKTELGNDVWVNRTVDGGDTTSYLVTSLKKFTSYKFIMQAFNSKGASPSECCRGEEDGSR
ncbi:Protein sidekick-2 [Desmophyllum pertusum]|uniref:Protein sidekick-2 n=1 Tax=Desmophyllum pertusum TaxID=174260 RepID=A0A9X0D5G6_9CNID|nr:Protein sidekick-2 [Desmophyllum pertusum]